MNASEVSSAMNGPMTMFWIIGIIIAIGIVGGLAWAIWQMFNK